MGRSVTVDQLSGEIKRLEREMEKLHKSLQSELAGKAIGFLGGQTSPVLTGAYRASHTVIQGAEFLYKGDDWVPDNEVVPVEPKARFAPASGEYAQRDCEQQGKPYQKWEIRNGRYYADWVENKYVLYARAKELVEYTAESMSSRNIDLE